MAAPVFITLFSRWLLCTSAYTVEYRTPRKAPLLDCAYTVYMYTYRPTLKYSMSTVPPGVLLLYTANKSAYTARSYSTTQREFLADPVLQPKAVAFQPEAPLLVSKFQVDKSL
jgi:hypothetical protein